MNDLIFIEILCLCKTSCLGLNGVHCVDSCRQLPMDSPMSTIPKVFTNLAHYTIKAVGY